MKILLLAAHRVHLRNFVSSGLAARLPGQIIVVAPLEDWGQVPASLRRHLTFCALGHPAGPGRTRLRRFLRLGSMVAREHRSVTMQHKLANEGRSKWQIAFWRALKRVADPEAIGQCIEALLPPSRSAQTIIDAIRPNVLLWPTLIHQSDDTEIVKAAKARAIPIMAMPASWDTLFSKAAMLVRPDRLLVWGEASKQSALTDHGFQEDHVHITGPPHWDCYEEMAAPPLRPRVFVAGTSLHFWSDEAEIVMALAESMNGFPRSSILYRPHPSRIHEDRSWLARCPSVDLDERIGYDLRPGFQEHIQDAIAGSSCVVAAWSTLMVEAALLGRPSVVPAFAKSAHGPGGVLRHASYQHMQSVVQWPGICVHRTFGGLIERIASIIRGEFRYDPYELRRRALQIALADGHAQERIVAAVKALVR